MDGPVRSFTCPKGSILVVVSQDPPVRLHTVAGRLIVDDHRRAADGPVGSIIHFCENIFPDAGTVRKVTGL
jgi:hypothetical protein